MTNYLSTESEADHAERVGVDETTEERQWCDGCVAYVATGVDCGHDTAVKAELELVTLVCSCGFKTCPLLPRFGLTDVTFEVHIKPIPSQYARDSLALEIKAVGGL